MKTFIFVNDNSYDMPDLYLVSDDDLSSAIHQYKAFTKDYQAYAHLLNEEVLVYSTTHQDLEGPTQLQRYTVREIKEALKITLEDFLDKPLEYITEVISNSLDKPVHANFSLSDNLSLPTLLSYLIYTLKMKDITLTFKVSQNTLILLIPQSIPDQYKTITLEIEDINLQLLLVC